jgi:hypothetical protein
MPCSHGEGEHRTVIIRDRLHEEIAVDEHRLDKRSWRPQLMSHTELGVFDQSSIKARIVFADPLSEVLLDHGAAYGRRLSQHRLKKAQVRAPAEACQAFVGVPASSSERSPIPTFEAAGNRSKSNEGAERHMIFSPDGSRLLLGGQMIDIERAVREFGGRFYHVHAKDLEIDRDGLYRHGTVSLGMGWQVPRLLAGREHAPAEASAADPGAGVVEPAVCGDDVAIIVILGPRQCDLAESNRELVQRLSGQTYGLVIRV